MNESLSHVKQVHTVAAKRPMARKFSPKSFTLLLVAIGAERASALFHRGQAYGRKGLALCLSVLILWLPDYADSQPVRGLNYAISIEVCVALEPPN